MRKLGLGLGFTNAIGGLITDPFIGALGDSTSEQMFTQYSGAGEASYETEAANYYSGSVDFYDVARTGSFLLESTALSNDAGNTNLFWVDDSAALSDGPQLTNNITNDANAANIYTCSLGINDNAEITTVGATVADIEDAFDYIADAAITKGASKFMLNTLGRDAAGDDDGCNILREGTIEAIKNNAQIQRGVDIYDLAYTDNKHPTQASYEEKGEREAIQNAYYLGNTSTQALGAYISSATITVDEITINLTHVGGSDIVAPSSGNGGIDAEDDGTAMGATTLSRVDATTAKLEFPEGKAPIDGSVIKMFLPYGANGGLLNTNPDVMVDNTARALPIQSDVVSVTNADPIQALDNLQFYFDARGSVKTRTTTEIESIAKIDGAIASASEDAAGAHAVWDENGFGGVGSFKFNNTTRFLYGGNGNFGSTQTIAFVYQHPDPVSNGDILFFANSGASTDNQAKLVLAGSNVFVWSLNEASSNETISVSQTSGQTGVIMLEFVSDSVCNVYFDGATTADYTFDPRNDFNNWDYIILGPRLTGGSTAIGGFEIGAYFHTTDTLTTQEKTDIYQMWSDRFGL